MGIHKNAPLTPAGREILVRRVLDEGQTPKAVATAKQRKVDEGSVLGRDQGAAFQHLNRVARAR